MSESRSPFLGNMCGYNKRVYYWHNSTTANSGLKLEVVDQ